MTVLEKIHILVQSAPEKVHPSAIELLFSISILVIYKINKCVIVKSIVICKDNITPRDNGDLSRL